jgi:hypothetical protein
MTSIGHLRPPSSALKVRSNAKELVVSNGGLIYQGEGLKQMWGLCWCSQPENAVMVWLIWKGKEGGNEGMGEVHWESRYSGTKRYHLKLKPSNRGLKAQSTITKCGGKMKVTNFITLFASEKVLGTILKK